MDKGKIDCWNTYIVKMIKGAFEDDPSGLKLLLYIINIVNFFSPSIMIIYVLNDNLLVNPKWTTIFIMIMISGGLYNLLRYTTMAAHIKYDKKEKIFVPKKDFENINYNAYICNMMGLTTAIIFITNLVIIFTKATSNKRIDIILYICATLSVVIFWGIRRIHFIYLKKSKNN